MVTGQSFAEEEEVWNDLDSNRRRRLRDILALDAAKAFPALAGYLAFSTDLSAGEVAELLWNAPLDTEFSRPVADLAQAFLSRDLVARSTALH